jgi:hypothetical protein
VTQPAHLAGIRRASYKAGETFRDGLVLAEGRLLQLNDQRPVRGTRPLEEAVDARLVEHVDPVLADRRVGGVDEPIQILAQRTQSWLYG